MAVMFLGHERCEALLPKGELGGAHFPRKSNVFIRDILKISVTDDIE
jgi:hypothetical protein